MRKAFQMFDTSKSGFIETIKISTILNTMGQLFDDAELNNLITKNDPDRSGKVNFDGFCNIAAHFLEEDDDESTQQELKEAFRLVYCKVGHFRLKVSNYHNRFCLTVVLNSSLEVQSNHSCRLDNHDLLHRSFTIPILKLLSSFGC